MSAPPLPLQCLRGVLEIGPGRRPHLPPVPSDPWIGVEPDRRATRWLQEQVTGRPVTVHAVPAERLPLPDHSIDTVVASSALCSVRDPARVLREVRRVLRPGGRFTFVEHVAAPRGTALRTAQAVWGLGTRFVDGCRPDRAPGASRSRTSPVRRTVDRSGFDG